MLISNITNTIENNYNYKYKKINFYGVTEDFGKELLKITKKNTPTNLDKINICEKLKHSISDIMKPPRLINCGFFNNVYKIDDNFVAKIRKKFTDKPWLLGNEYKQGINKFKDLETYYGEEIVDIGGVKILKNIGEHIPAGIPESKLSKMDYDEISSYYNHKYLPAFADAPQESYDAIAKDFKRLNNKIILHSDYHYDFDGRNPNNIALRKKDKKIVMIDELDVRATENTNDTSKLLRMLLLSLTRNDTIYYYDKIGQSAAKKIFEKIILATERSELPNLDKAKGINYWRLVFKNLEIKRIPESFVNKLEELRNANINLEERLNKVKELVHELFV